MALTAFPPSVAEATDDGKEPGNIVHDKHLVVRGSLAVGRDLGVAGLFAAAGGMAGPSLTSTGTVTIDGHGQMIASSLTEELTLSAAGATTDSTANLLPENSFILGVVFRVTEAINNRAAYSIGDGTTAARFQATGSALTKDTTGVGLAHLSGAISTAATGPTQASAAKLRITTSGGTQNSTGKVRVTVFYIQFVAPTS